MQSRAMSEQLVRKYFYDARHLTDLVRCCIIVDSIDDARNVISKMFERSSLFGCPSGDEDEGEPMDDDEEALLPMGGSSRAEQKKFIICKVTSQPPLPPLLCVP
jgi:hypothetical protein